MSYALIRRTAFLMVIPIMGCNQISPKSDLSTEDLKDVKDSILSSPVKDTMIFSKQDSIELHAIGNYYFGKMRHLDAILNIAGVNFIGYMISNDYKYYFSNIPDSSKIIFFNPSSQQIKQKIVDIISYKLGNPLKIPLHTEKDLLNTYNKVEEYYWEDKFKIINLVVRKRDKSEVLSYLLTVTNKKLKKEFEKNKKKKYFEDVKNEGSKL